MWGEVFILFPELLQVSNIDLFARLFAILALAFHPLDLIQELLFSFQFCFLPLRLLMHPSLFYLLQQIHFEGNPADACERGDEGAADQGEHQAHFVLLSLQGGLVVAQHIEGEEDHCRQQVHQHAYIVEGAFVWTANDHPNQQQQLNANSEEGDVGELALVGITKEKGGEEHEGEEEGNVLLAAERQSLKGTARLLCNKEHSPLVEEDQTG